VYFGTSYDDVNDANTLSDEYKGNYDANSYDPSGLELDTIYYWRIDEVADTNIYKGDVWSFKTYLEPNLISWWKFDEDSGNIAYDSAGNNHGTIYGATWTTGQINTALSFDGVDDYVEVADDVSLDFTTVYTGTWINTSSNGLGAVVNKRDEKINVDWQGFVLFVEDGYVRFGADDGPNLSYTPISGTKIDDGQWHYIGGKFDGQNVTTYVDGVENTKLDASSVTGNLNNDDELRIGAQWDGSSKYVNLFDGIIDEVRIWNEALSGEEIKQLYHNGLAGW